MPEPDTLHRHSTRLGTQDRERLIEGLEVPALKVAAVERLDGSKIGLGTLDDLMDSLRTRSEDARWAANRPRSDQWLAPRIHFALRMTRAEASDKGIWQALAVRYHWYLDWRWSSASGVIAEERWWGAVHKQAFSRLWWGGEMFRNGSDYRPVVQAFLMQDFPNSYLHRTVVRCRPLTLAVLERLHREALPTADQVNSLARVLNLSTGGAPPELETDFVVDDVVGYQDWSASSPAPRNWDLLPAGPLCDDTTPASLEGGARIVDRAWRFAEDRKARS